MSTTILPATYAEIRDYNAYTLANRADCATPDSLTSEGATFLTRVRDAVLEAVEYSMGDGRTAGEALADLEDNGANEIADSAPSVYTYQRWQEFTDLGAWNEDVDDIGGSESSDMTERAGLALYLIADRLVRELVSELRDGLDDEDTDEEEEGSTEAEWLYDSAYATPREQTDRVKELIAAHPEPEFELKTTKSIGGLYEVYVRNV